MSAPAKLLHVLGLLAKEETTYGTAVSLSTTADGLQLQYQDRNVGAPLTLTYAFDGAMGPSVSALGQQVRVSPSGFSVSGDLPMRSRPGGVAYTASVVPSLHRILKAAGFNATLTTAAGSEKWVYTPTPAGAAYTSLSTGLYTRGELWSATGVIGNLRMEFANPAPPIYTFSMSGIASLPTDAAAPAITYPLQTIAPPLASTLSLTLGSFTAAARVMSGSFDLQREISPRVRVSGGGAHLGFVPADRAPMLKVVLEATALASSPYTTSTGFDPYRLRDAGTVIAAGLQFGSAQYFREKLNFAQAQIIDVVPQNDGPVATVELTIAAHNSTASAIDDVTITFD
jgi:hypothetical protein